MCIHEDELILRQLTVDVEGVGLVYLRLAGPRPRRVLDRKDTHSGLVRMGGFSEAVIDLYEILWLFPVKPKDGI